VASTWGRSTNIVKALIAAGADVNAKDARGETALALAKLAKYNADIVAVLKAAGARE